MMVEHHRGVRIILLVLLIVLTAALVVEVLRRDPWDPSVEAAEIGALGLSVVALAYALAKTYA